MIVRSSRVLILFLAAALVGLAMIFGVLIFQLSQGPISLNFLTPVVERALDSVSEDTQVRLHDTVLTWDEERRALDIRATGLQFMDPAGRVRATVPEMNVTFSARALLRGLVAPTNLELFGPRLKIIRSESGEVSIDFGDSNDPNVDSAAPVALVQELLRPPNRELASGYLSGVAVRSAFIELEDRLIGQRFVVPNATVQLSRGAEGIRAVGTITMGAGEEAIHLELSGAHRADSRRTNLGIVFSEIAPSAFVQFAPNLEILARLNTRLDGTLTVSIDADFKAIVGNLDLRATEGTIDAGARYKTPITFDSAALRLSAHQADETISVESLKVVLGETVITVSGEGSRSDGTWETSWIAALRDLPINDIDAYWPAGVEPETRKWVTENIRDGHVATARLNVSAAISETNPGSSSLDDIAAEIQFRDAVVHYLRPMEPATGAIGVARIDSRRAVIDIEQASLRGVIAERGRIVIDGLDGPARGETIKIDMTVAGPVRDTLEVLDTEPLGFISSFGIDPARTTGMQRTNAVFAFPLREEITVNEIAVATSSRLVRFSAENVAFGFALTLGDLALNVNRDGLKAEGTAKIGEIPVQLTFKESFTERNKVRTHYKVRTTLDIAAREQFGITLAPYLTGPVAIGLTYSLGWDDVGVGAAEIDLTPATLLLEPFGWTKAPDKPGSAFFRFFAPNEKTFSVSEFQVAAGDLDAAGSANFLTNDGTFKLQNLSLERLRFGENDIFLNVEIPSGAPPVISVGGNAVDLRPMMEDIFDNEDDDGEAGTPAMRIFVSDQSPIGSVRLGEETRFIGAYGTITDNGSGWSEVNLDGVLSNAGSVSVRIAPEGNLRRLTLETDDAGGLLRALDWIDTIRKGELRVRGTIVGTGAAQVVAGQVDLQNFILTEEPFAAKLLALASFSGISDVLGGEGITFRRAEIPFQMIRQEVAIENAKARGAEIGVIVSGRIDRDTGAIAFAGEVAPAYTLNSLLANIPLIGRMLSGGSDGIFAATFNVDGDLDEPNVSVNPLSVLTPGIVRRLLSGFAADSDPVEQLAPESPSQAQ